ncbi:hypothetical protein SSP35_01_03340 [Streptomyces sp. NBRC 110611]|uniref:hypothetical protein n=1 Tax=Streptomyces sp. NBRC 110611 TaxID=1621259 RepID=UPI000831F9EF|nr:hypothetical protein [Streptomyces sp. NBRC 110611]GAU64997.1 hypothetical protein SSP35_01_03340 [Streptomyces sp. NBRC 110611]
MTSRRRAVATTAALACGAALIAGAAYMGAPSAPGDPDGEGDLAGKSAQQISDDALGELVAAKSLRLRTQTTANPTKLDLVLDRGGNCAGSISKGPFGRVQIIKRGNKVWLKPDAAFWKSQLPGREGTEAAEKYKNKYLHGTTRDDFLQSLSVACDLTAFQESAVGPSQPPSGTPPPSAPLSPTPTPTLSKGKPTVHEGTPVLPVTKKFDGVVQTLYVATNGRPYPLKLTAEANHQIGTILLSNYGTPVPTKTPDPRDTVDVAVYEDLIQGTKSV